MKLEPDLLTILESLHDAVIIISKDSTIEYINKAYSEQFQVPAAKLIGRKLRDVEPTARILNVLEKGIPLINDYSYVHSLKKDVYANITPLKENGETVGAVTIMKDISEIKKLREELNNYKRYSNHLEKQLNRQNASLLESQVPEMKKAVSLAYKVASTDATVLLCGESGVGKEVFAHAIHQASHRKNKPFIPINMPSIPDALFESECFGYEEGSFTGSRKGGKTGLFETGNGGTLFLDEISEMSLNVQAKVLRVIQEFAFHKVGGTKLHPLDVRIICATNQDLEKLVQEGKFREDLYYRLNVVPILIPPLRDRKADIPFLAQQILHRLTTKYGKYVTVDHDVYNVFESYDWPGNVRELVNVLERMIVVCQTTHLKVDDIPHFIWDNVSKEQQKFAQYEGHSSNTSEYLQDVLEQTERNLFEKAIKNSRNRTEAIKKLGISRKTFYARLKKYGIK